MDRHCYNAYPYDLMYHFCFDKFYIHMVIFLNLLRIYGMWINECFKLRKCFCHSTNFKILSKKKINLIIIATYLQFMISFRGSHCAYSPPGTKKPSYATVHIHSFPAFSSWPVSLIATKIASVLFFRIRVCICPVNEQSAQTRSWGVPFCSNPSWFRWTFLMVYFQVNLKSNDNKSSVLNLFWSENVSDKCLHIKFHHGSDLNTFLI
jgi:hypothetical protein